jgi:hypothetical protein
MSYLNQVVLPIVWESEFSDNFWRTSPTLNINKTCEMWEKQWRLQMILYKTGFIMYLYGWKSELPDNFWW